MSADLVRRLSPGLATRTPVILQSEGNWTLAVGMYQWVSDEMSKNWGQFAAGSVLGSIPILILFLTLQRYIVGGLTAGSVKG